MPQSENTSVYRRTHGFRFSMVDAIVLIVTVIGTLRLAGALGAMGLIPAFVVLHFFLFCNVFRIRRAPELIWGLCFVALALVLLLIQRFTPKMLMLWQLPFTVGLIVRDMRHPSYHGVFARRLNPRLDEYLSGRLQHSSTDPSPARSSV